MDNACGNNKGKKFVEFFETTVLYVICKIEIGRLKSFFIILLKHEEKNMLIPMERYEECSERPTNSTLVMYQQWKKLIFLHWEFPVDLIQRHIPPHLKVDCYDGKAYVGVVSFIMEGVRPKYLPCVPGLSSFGELNLRTYVYDKRTKIPGVWFFTLDAHQFVAVQLARYLFNLPYFYSKLSFEKSANRITYSCTNSAGKFRTQSEEAFESTRNLTKIKFALIDSPKKVEKGSLEYFLVERYVLYNTDRRGRVHHSPYQIQNVELEEFDNNLFYWFCPEFGRITDNIPPVNVLYSEGVNVDIFWLEAISN